MEFYMMYVRTYRVWLHRVCISSSSIYAHRFSKQFTFEHTTTEFKQGKS